MATPQFKNQNFEWIDFEKPTLAEISLLEAEYELERPYLDSCLKDNEPPRFEKTATADFIVLRFVLPPPFSKIKNVQSLSRKVAFWVLPTKLISIHNLTSEEFNFIIKPVLRRFELRKSQIQINELLKVLISESLKSFYSPLDSAEELLGDLDDLIFEENLTNLLNFKVPILRKQISLLKRLLLHTQDVVNHFRDEPELVHQVSTLLQLSDELLEETDSALNLQISFANQRTNEVMRILTIFSVFFMPLTFICSIYGMNFKYMPELESPIGYQMVLLSMLAISLGIGFWFYRKKWILRPRLASSRRRSRSSR